MIGTTLSILGSLGMFLFGMKIMSESLQKLSGERLRGIMRTMTGNRFAGVGTGFLVTCMVQSSSASTVMMVSFVNAGLLTLVEAIGMIMGANIGTTTTFWLVSFFGFKFSISAIALPVMGLALPLLFARKPRLRNLGEFCMGFGLLFIGLMFLKDAVPDIKNNPEVLGFIKDYTGRGLASTLIFLGFGILLTIIVQSSSVAGAITLTMAYKGWIDFPTACAITLGENIGTTITANLAALGGNVQAKRAARVHFIFNVIGVVWAIALFNPFVNFVQDLVPADATDPVHMPLHMAAFHTLFNVLNTALLIGFVPQLARLAERLVKDKATAPARDHMDYDSPLVPRTGELNLAEAERDLQRMGAITRELVMGFSDLFENPPADLEARMIELKELEKESDRRALATTQYLLRCASGGLSEETRARVTSMLRVVAELEDICDCGYRLVLLAERKHRKRRQHPPEVTKQVRDFSQLLLQFMDFYSSRLTTGVVTADMETAYQLENLIDAFRKNLRKESVRRMRVSGDVIKAEMLYIDMLNNMESIGNHSLNVLQALRHES
ncbi:MAG TPA: Na/Pi cotransporter family protein [Opitutaceae bacterium]|nr:Na/Pi cotransporter family protein [Opitutaceae bacterium]HRJ46619.1 Na/Pi cotransporter family protein [Opitutaceae bacterium]